MTPGVGKRYDPAGVFSPTSAAGRHTRFPPRHYTPPPTHWKLFSHLGNRTDAAGIRWQIYGFPATTPEGGGATRAVGLGETGRNL